MLLQPGAPRPKRRFPRDPATALVGSLGTQALILLLNILTGVITARMLGPEGRGMYVAIALWPTLLSTLATAGLGSALVFRLRKAPEAASHTIAAALLLTTVASLVAVAAGVLLLPHFLLRYEPAIVLFAQVCLLNTVVNSVQALTRQSFAGIGKYWYCNLSQLLPQIFHFVALVAAIPLAAMSPRYAILALLASSGLALLVLLPKIIHFLRPRFRGAAGELRSLVSFSMRAAPMDVVYALATYSDRLVLIPLLPPEQLGFYAVAFSFSRVLQYIQPAITSVFLSHISAQTESDGVRLHNRAFRFVFVCLAVTIAVLWAVGHGLLVFAYGPEFGEAVTVFRLLLLEAALGALSQVTVQLFLSRNRPGIVSAIQGIVLALCVAALLILVPRYGGMGAAICLLGAAAIRWLLLLGAMRAILKVPFSSPVPGRDDVRDVIGWLRYVVQSHHA